MIKHVVCAVSGGVDSAVTALLLKKKNFNVTGVFMRNWDISDEKGQCTVNQDSEDARFVCEHIGIPFHEVSFVKEYWNEVFSLLIDGYEQGITPNPDVLCNRHVKFGHLFSYATERLGADALATGHYARSTAGPYLENLDNCFQGVNLLQSADGRKDQTLFLSQINQKALQRTMFPVGTMKKTVIKQIAAEAGLDSIVKKKESTGICFIGSRHFQDFIEQYVVPRPGNFVDVETGAVVGKHRGVHHWTIGQRTHIGGLSQAYFVASRHALSQTVLVASGTDHPALFSQFLSTGRPHWINLPPLRYRTGGESFPCHFRFQHTHPLLNCRVSVNLNGCLDIELEKPIRALSPGQYAVLYDGEVCLGSAPIRCVGPTMFELFQNSLSRRRNWCERAIS